MLLMRGLIAAALMALTLPVARAEDPAPLPKTYMAERGKLLLQEDLNKPFTKDWKAAKGKWEVVGGAMRGAELAADMHGAVARYPLAFKNVIIQYDIKLEGARQTTLSINKEKGHLCRVLINSSGLTIQKDKDKKTTDKAVVLDSKKMPVAPGTWHTLVVELLGNEMLASLDGKDIVFGANPALDAAKANFGFTVAGESVSFKNLRVWQAERNPRWDGTRAKLLADRKKD